VVLTGHRASLDGLGRLVYAARRIGGDAVTVYDFRGALPTAGASTVPRLGDAALAACEQLIEGLAEPAPVAEERPALLAVGD
jgi:undecaprenyl pyrophosphate synthase